MGAKHIFNEGTFELEERWQNMPQEERKRVMDRLHIKANEVEILLRASSLAVERIRPELQKGLHSGGPSESMQEYLSQDTGDGAKAYAASHNDVVLHAGAAEMVAP